MTAFASLQRQKPPASTAEHTNPSAVMSNRLPSAGRPLDPATQSAMESRFNHDFSQVRVHTDGNAAESAQAVRANAYTVGRDIFFDAGSYAPHTMKGRRLLAHELTHVVQQNGSARPDNVPDSLPVLAQDHPAEKAAERNESIFSGDRQESPVTTGMSIARDAEAEGETMTLPAVQSFEDRMREFREHRFMGRDAEAAAMAPGLISSMGAEEGRRYALEIAFWLMDRGDWAQAQSALRALEDGWWIQYVTSGVPVNLFSIPDTPRQLYERARAEAVAGRHEQASRLLGLAYIFVQFILHDASTQREGQLERMSERLRDFGSHAPEVAPSISALTRIMAYSELGGIYSLLRDILGMYPRLEREAIAAGNQDLARQLSGLGLLVQLELRERYTLSNARALTMESAATTTQFGGAGYTIYGRDISTTETVTPLPGTRTPEELGSFPSYGAEMETLRASIAGQEAYLTELFAHPEIRAEFGSNLPNMNSLNDRLRVWRTMFRVYQRENMFPLGGLMNLIRRYLEHFTFHSEYNIRDYGVSYLSSDFPEDLAGRAVRDCGVYALMTAYEVYRTARSVSPNLNLDFQLYAMPEHVILVIFDRDEDNFYVVNNNRITGPRRGDVLAEVAREYGQVFGRQYGVAPGVEVNLGSTAQSQAAFSRQLWQRYQVGTATGLRPEVPPGSTMTPGEATHATYERYYEDLERFDRGARSLEGQLNQLRDDTAAAESEAARRTLRSRLPEMTRLGRALATVFARRGPQADIIVDERRARAALGPGFASQVPQIVGSQHIFLFTQARGHPLARLAMALLRQERLGDTLPPDAQTFIQAVRLIREFNEDINAYDRAGRPAAF